MDFDFVFSWCVNHWQFLLTALLSIINIVVLLIKRKIKLSDTALTSVLALIPGWIKDAENMYGPGHGDEKLTYVLNVALHYLCDATGYKETDVVRGYGSLVSSYIENVLATPTKKKEVLYEDKSVK